ncbi:MlaD family protein [Rhodococcus sp. NPDC003382]
MRTISLESEAGAPTDRILLIRGLVGLVVIAAVVAVLLLRSTGSLDDRVAVTALLPDVGDGIPAKSDVKFRGLVVGIVTGVEPGRDGRPNEVSILLEPHDAQGIPETVTARVVPSNVFAVSSVQLVDNGAGAPLTDGAVIPADTSRPTVELQTALTKMRDIVAAVGRDRRDATVGVLTALASATENRGQEIRDAGGQLVDMTTALNAAVDDGSDRSQLVDLATALRGLQESAPELLDAVHHSAVPMLTVAEKQAALTDLLAAGQYTMGTTERALGNNADRMITITGQLAPVLDLLAAGGAAFPGIATDIAVVSRRFSTEFWDPARQRGTGHFVWTLTPHKVFGPADCPRYGDLAGPSCTWPAPAGSAQPVLPASLDPRNFRPPAALSGGNVGPVGGPAEMEALRELLGEQATTAASLILGPLLRGMNVSVDTVPVPAGAGDPVPVAEGGR